MEIVLYGCEDCAYCTLRKPDYDRHLKTKKHHKLFYTNRKICYRCGYKFASSQGLERHLNRIAKSSKICNDTFYQQKLNIQYTQPINDIQLINFNCYNFKGNIYKYLFALSDIDTFLPMQPISILLFKNQMEKNNNDILKTLIDVFINPINKRSFFVHNNEIYYKYKNSYKRSINQFAKFELKDLELLSGISDIDNSQFIMNSFKSEINNLLL